MPSPFLNLDKQDRKTRKQWIVLLFLQYLFFPLSLVIGLFVICRVLPVQIPRIIVEIAVQNGFYGILSFWVLWFCAYRRPGIIALTLSLIFTPIQTVLLIYSRFPLLKDFDLLSFCILFFNILFTTLIYILTLRVRKINKSIRNSRSPSDPT